MANRLRKRLSHHDHPIAATKWAIVDCVMNIGRKCTRRKCREFEFALRNSLADDSGLSAAALDGAPGIYSARWAGPDKDFALAMKKVEERLEETGSRDRSAWFTSALAVAWPDGPCVVVEGRVDGQLVFPPRGDGGHGYDPVFQPEGSDKTFAEMDAAEKDAVSHRGRAFDKLKAALMD